MSSIDVPLQEETTQQGQGNQGRFLWNVVSEHWLMLLIGTLVGAIAFGGYTLLAHTEAPVRYGTSAKLTITAGRTAVVRSLRTSGASTSLYEMTAGDLQAGTSLSDLSEEVARGLIQKDIAAGGRFGSVATPDEFRKQANEIAKKITVNAPDERTIEIRVQGCARAQEADDIAEYATRAFLEMNRKVHLEKANKNHVDAVAIIQSLRQKLAEAEQARLAFMQKHGFRAYGDLDQQLTSKADSLREIETAKETAQQKLAQLDAELALAAKQFSMSLNQPSDNMVNGLFLDLDDLLEEKMSLAAIYQPSWPRLLELEEEIAETQGLILEAEKQKASGVPGGSDIWTKRKEIYRQQIELRLQTTSLEIREAAIRKEREELIPRVPELANLKLDADRLRREVDNIELRLNQAADREMEIRVAIERGLASVERKESIAPAAMVRIPDGPQAWISFAIGGLIAFVVTFGFVMLMEYNDTSIRSIEDVNEYIGLEVIGTIPRMRFGRPRGGRRRRATYVSTVDEEQIDSCIVTQHDPKSPVSEAYRTLRTNFQFATIKKKPRTVMVTSAVPGEGKTTTAVNRAVTMADRGMRVLIVDTDLRRPNVHRVLRMERGPGLADVLREGLEPKSVIRPTRIENLWIISSGRVPPNPSELIGSDHMAQLMAQLGDEFDLVICDAPSVLVVTDPVLLATHVDTCMMVVSTNNARRETVIRAKKLLSTAQVDVAGVVVNGLETTRRHYYYYYYYYDDGSTGRRKWYHF
ncbi:MAG: polysaccharide biosynthesis tyrosine autokinase [Candidatus Hydrogenedentes bacterium]|nr:polysaccharide biosynthesis tyrosine autokinase [Candidatus Hydrogenedentota bacterium]